jgi:uncharacterized repeat protein (TIGR01451 family)
MLSFALMTIGTRAEAQVTNGLAYSMSGSPNSVGLGANLTYTINLTNLSDFQLVVFVTNALDIQSTLISATNSYPGGSVSSTGNVVVFSLNPFANNTSAQMTTIVQPTGSGSITNTVTVNINDVTNFSISIVNEVTNTTTTSADLAVAMTGPSSAVFTNDWMTYGVSVTNLGPSTASDVMLTNTLPTGVGFESVSPSNTAYTVIGSNVIFNLGTLASGAFTNLQLTVQPTNAGVLLFSSFVNSTSMTDPNPTNNTATTNITVTNYFPASLVVFTNSGQKYNLQNNLVEQSLLLTNQGTNAVDSARIVVSGLAKTNVLFNAVGTNNGNPFVVYGTSLAAGQSVGLLLQFAANNYFPFTNSQLQAFAVIPPNLTPPAGTLSTNLNITRIVKLTSGSMLIWFPSISNRTYTVEYTSNLISTFYVTNYVTSTNNPGVTNVVVQANSVFSTNWLMAQPSVVAPTTDTEWIDYGPPGTLSHPTNTPVRFYRVFLNP